MKIADRWFESRRVDVDVTLLWEPHVDPLLRCNIWHVRGTTRDLLVDTGMGIASLEAAVRDLVDKPVIALATHTHLDHMGSLHEFDVRAVHRLEAAELDTPTAMSLDSRDWPADFVRGLEDAGYALRHELLLSALPRPGFDPRAFAAPPARATWLLDDGDVVDLGSRRFEVLHLPGHSPGSIGLWEASTGTLFSGDAVYDGPLLDRLDGSDVAAYVRTMERLRDLPVTVVHGGHDPSFGRDRLVEIARDYIERRGAA